MSTGTIENWTGNMLDVGPMYPFVGAEVLLWVVGMVLWIGWHIWQSRFEDRTYKHEVETYAKGDNLKKALED